MKKISRRATTTAVEKWQLFEDDKDITLTVTKKVTKNKETVTGVNLKAVGPHGSNGQFVTPKFFEEIKKKNPWAEHWDGKKHVYGLPSGCYVDPKDIFEGKVEVTKKDLVYFYSAGHFMFDHEGKALPTVIHVNYIGTPLTNEVCDVDKLAEHLNDHKWVVNKDKIVAESVPYYNNEGGWRREVKGEEVGVISILPPKKALHEMYENSLKINKGKYWSTNIKELLLSGPTWTWKPEWKKDKDSVYKDVEIKDYLNIKQFYKPHDMVETY